MTFQSLPGFREFYPEDLARRNHLFRLWRQAASAYGFAEYDAPVLEPLELYKAKSGEEIEGQLFAFTDKGGREVALRPEMTPSVCRLVGARAGALKRPVKWFSIAEFYRYERMQRGRGRCFFQFNADIFGEPGPEAEIELIALLIQSFAGFGLTKDDFIIRLSDRNLWFHYLAALGIGNERALAVLTVVDKYAKNGMAAFKEYDAQFGPLAAGLQSAILKLASIRSREDLTQAFLSPEALVGRLVSVNVPVPARHTIDTLFQRIAEWEKLLAGLDAMGLADFIQVDLGVVRGLAYYTGFVFEAFDRKGELRALAGGGRYDNLVAKLGGPELPAAGFAIGDITFALLLEQRGLMPALARAAHIYCVIAGGGVERRAAFADIQALRAAGYAVEYPFKAMGFGKQFKAAAEAGARLALIYGSDEIAKGVVKFHDMRGGAEHDVPRADVAGAVREFLAGGPK